MDEKELTDLLLNGECRGSAGAALIIKDVLTRSDVGGAVTAVDAGTLIQVWMTFDDVTFSPLLENRIQLDDISLICKLSDVGRVPKCIWGALLPLSRSLRIHIARNESLASRLASIKEGSHVDITDGHQVAQICVIRRLCNPTKFKGVHYGVKFMGPGFKQPSSIEDEYVPDGCDIVVNLSSFFTIHSKESVKSHCPRDNRGNIPKSASHHTFQEYESSGFVQRNNSSSLDSHTSSTLTPAAHKSLNPTIVPVHLTAGHSKSRSLDLFDNESNKVRPARLDRGQKRVSGDLTIGSLIEFMTQDMDEPSYGVIQWIGYLPDSENLMVGVELEEEIGYNEDTLGLFQCSPFKARFVNLSECRRDARFQELHSRPCSSNKTAFGQKDCPIVEGVISPISYDVKDICGKNKGIQGHNNSCYLDATLFAMFAFTSVFDSVLYRPAMDSDHRHYSEVQRVLRDEIVNPLRKNAYVRADRVMKLRTLLDKISSVTGLTSEEKDPEEFLNSLLMQTLKAEPFLQLSSGQEAFYYQLFVEKDERLNVPTVQQLIEQSFLSSGIKLKQLPSCLIIQMPRFGTSFKMYPLIIPSTTIDITDLIENSPRQCTVCGELAYFECKECYSGQLEGDTFCKKCVKTAHGHPSRQRHNATPLSLPLDYVELLETGAVPKLTMQLFAVLCIETSHYVAFLNTDEGWVFFDSMADRKGEQNGYNIPEIVHCPDLSYWLSEEGANRLAQFEDERELPPLPKRLLCDAYMCLYQSPQVMMYK